MSSLKDEELLELLKNNLEIQVSVREDDDNYAFSKNIKVKVKLLFMKEVISEDSDSMYWSE